MLGGLARVSNGKELCFSSLNLHVPPSWDLTPVLTSASPGETLAGSKSNLNEILH